MQKEFSFQENYDIKKIKLLKIIIKTNKINKIYHSLTLSEKKACCYPLTGLRERKKKS